MTILVTGATGNVGRHLVQQLVESGYPVRALTRNPAAAKLPVGVGSSSATCPPPTRSWRRSTASPPFALRVDGLVKIDEWIGRYRATGRGIWTPSNSTWRTRG